MKNIHSRYVYRIVMDYIYIYRCIPKKIPLKGACGNEIYTSVISKNGNIARENTIPNQSLGTKQISFSKRTSCSEAQF